MSDKHEFDSEISTDNNIAIPEHLRENFPPTSKVKVGIAHNNQERTEPKYLYRYRPFDKYSKDILINNRLWFSSPKDFNDPFDCKVIFDTASVSREDWIRYFKEVTKIRNPRISYSDMMSEVLSTVNVFKSDKYAENEHILQMLSNIYVTHDFLKILCLSSKNDDILMWSHYSDSHKGFCLEFDKKLIEQLREDLLYYICTPVEYTGKYPAFQEANHIMENINIKKDPYQISFFARKKAEHWRYEDEWRCIMIPTKDDMKNTNGINVSFPPEMLNSVIFGCEMKDDARKELRKLIKSNPKLSHVRFHEAKKKPNEFGLYIFPPIE